MLTALYAIIFLNFLAIFSHFKFIPYFSVLQNFVQNGNILTYLISRGVIFNIRMSKSSKMYPE